MVVLYIRASVKVKVAAISRTTVKLRPKNFFIFSKVSPKDFDTATKHNRAKKKISTLENHGAKSRSQNVSPPARTRTEVYSRTAVYTSRPPILTEAELQASPTLTLVFNFEENS